MADSTANHVETPKHGFPKRVARELGLTSLYSCAHDVKLLIAQRFVRLFAYGTSTLVLVAYLDSLGISKTRVGLFMTLTLVGDVAISFLLTLFADGLGRRFVLGLGAALMAASGIVFALSGNYWVLLAAAVFGVISPSGNEIGPFRAIEESTIAHLTESATRSDIYAWYGLTGTGGAGLGMVTCGWVVHYLHFNLKWEFVRAYRAVFFGYAAFGIIKLLFVLFMSSKVESDAFLERRKKKAQAQQTSGETEPLLAGIEGAAGERGHVNHEPNGAAAAITPDTQHQPPSPAKRTLKSVFSTLVPKISRESVGIVINLCILFGLDAFASSLASLSWITYFFRSHYNVEEGRLGSIFFSTNIISAMSMLVASALSRRFGNVNTMVFTHLPSSIFLALIPLPNEVHFSLVLLVLRACTQSMDGPPRSAFLAAIVLPQERTAIMGLVNVVKSTAMTIGPLITGVLVDRGLFWVAFVCAGSLKATYDLGLLAVFKNHEREKAERERLRAAAAAEGETDEEHGT